MENIIDNGIDSDNGKNKVTLTAVIDEPVTRTFIDGESYVCWSDGDLVWINGATYTVHVDGNTASINGVTEAQHYACVYPASVASDFTDGCKVKIELPETQTISFDASGRQILSLPMAAYGDGSSALQFKNICGLVGVNVKNTDKDEGMTVTGMMLSTGGDVDFMAPLYGKTWEPRNLSSDNLDNNWAVKASNVGSRENTEKQHVNVTVSQAPAIALNSSATYYVVVPVIDDGCASNITLRVTGNVTNGQDFLFRKTTAGTKTIDRNCLGVIPVDSKLCYESNTGSMKGSGTSSDPYQVACAAHFCSIATMTLNQEVTQNTCFIQVRDIDFDGACIEQIGGYGVDDAGQHGEYPFSGVYDGNGFSLTNFNILDSCGWEGTDGHHYTNSYLALFSYVKDGTVKNLNVSYERTVSSFHKIDNYPMISKPHMGGIVGLASGNTTLSNLTFSGNLTYGITEYDVEYEAQTPTNTSFGGIAATINGNGRIENSIFDGTLTLTGAVERIGGIAGNCTDNVISGCSSTENSLIELDGGKARLAGGLFGLVIAKESFTNCKFGGKIQNSNDYAYGCIGGIAGSFRTEDGIIQINKLETSDRTTMVLDNAKTYPYQSYIYVGGLFGEMHDELSQYAGQLTNRTEIIFSGVGTTYGSSTYVGGIAGCMTSNCKNRMTNYGEISVTENDRRVAVGGIAGLVEGLVGSSQESPFISLVNEAVMSATSKGQEAYVGGLFGYVDISTSTIAYLNDCRNIGNVSAVSETDTLYAGGLAAFIEGNGGVIIVNKFYNSGAISGNAGDEAYVGGLVGHDVDSESSITLEIFNSVNEGDISAVSTNGNVAAGGFIGNHDSDGGTYRPCIINCFNCGDITANTTNTIYAGGFIGYCKNGQTEIGCSYSRCRFLTDSVYSSKYVGGLSGTAFKFNRSRWNTFEGNTLDVQYIYESAEGSDYEAWTNPSADEMNSNRTLVPDQNTTIYGEMPSLIEWAQSGDWPILELQ